MKRIKSRHGRQVWLSLSPEQAEILKFIGYRNIIIPEALVREGYSRSIVNQVEVLQDEINAALADIPVAL